MCAAIILCTAQRYPAVAPCFPAAPLYYATLYAATDTSSRASTLADSGTAAATLTDSQTSEDIGGHPQTSTDIGRHPQTSADIG
eukprot:9148544-Pyramimonas_sp.AAC.1